jgi:hypothetical protein
VPWTQKHLVGAMESAASARVGWRGNGGVPREEGAAWTPPGSVGLDGQRPPQDRKRGGAGDAGLAGEWAQQDKGRR